MQAALAEAKVGTGKVKIYHPAIIGRISFQQSVHTESNVFTQPNLHHQFSIFVGISHAAACAATLL